jgi:small conductance mechanosensitive channel
MDKLKDLFPDRFENLGIFISILVVTIIINWLSRRAFNRFMRLRASDIHVDLTNYKFLGNALTFIIYTVGISFAIREYPPLRTVAGSLLAGAGILAAIVGFASQQAFSNIVSGIFLIIFKPFRVGDRLRVKDIYNGEVEDITLRHTILRDAENRRIIVPNALMSSEILVNADYNNDPVCKHVEINVAYHSDIDTAKRIMYEEIEKHRLRIDNRTADEVAQGKPMVDVRIIHLADSAVVLRGYAWAKNASDVFDMYCDLLESVKKRYDAAGIEIPFPTRVIVNK